MGLTHYWQRPTELPAKEFAKAVADVRKVVEASGVALAGFDGTGQPRFGDDGFVFNGVGGAAVEPFEVRQIEFDRRGRNVVSCYCKTMGAPYDLCVRAALIVLRHHLGTGFSVTSDDRAEVNWAVALEHVRSAVSRDVEFALSEGPR